MKGGGIMKIADLDTKDQNKLILTLIITPRTIAEVSAKANKSYNYICQILSVLKAKGWVRKHKTPAGKVIYMLNKEEVQP